MYSFNDLEKILLEDFPEFNIDENMKGLPNVVFSFLAIHLVESIKEGNNAVMAKFVLLVNELSEIEDPIIDSCLDELILGLYDYSCEFYFQFLQKLSVRAQLRFKQTIDLWERNPSSS